MNFKTILKFIEDVIKNGVQNDYDERSIQLDILKFRDYLLNRKLTTSQNIEKIEKILDNLSQIIQEFKDSENANLLSNIVDFEPKDKIVKS